MRRCVITGCSSAVLLSSGHARLTARATHFGNTRQAIESFRGAWDLIILPLLTTHMTLTFLSAGLERIAKSGQA